MSVDVLEYRLEKSPINVVKNQSIGSLSENRWFINGNMTIGELTYLLKDEKSISAVGVIDDTGRAQGIIVTSELFSTMGRQYGWAILGRKRAEEILVDVPRFDFRENIFNVADSLEEILNEKDIAYFILEDKVGSFKGIISSRDILLHLSDMTKKDIDMAHKLQQKIANKRLFINEDRFDLIASTESAKGLGGDYYHAQSYDTDKWIFAVCDVSGKGVAASLLTTTIWGMMSIYNFKKGLTFFLKNINKYIFRTFEVEKFITGIFLDFNAKTGEVKVCDMGHSYIFLSRGNKIVQLESKGNMPIGVCEEFEDFKINKLTLKPGDCLFVPTDGLLEQGNSLESLYDIKNVNKIISSNEESSIELVSQAICDDFNCFREGVHLHDDVTFILIKYRPGKRAPSLSKLF